MSNIMRKINKNNGNRINVRQEKKFLKCVRETMLDFEDAVNNGNTDVLDILKSLKNILSTKQLTLYNVAELIPLIENGKTNTQFSFDVPEQVTLDIQREHNNMESILLRHFTWTEYLGLYAISFRNQRVS